MVNKKRLKLMLDSHTSIPKIRNEIQGEYVFVFVFAVLQVLVYLHKLYNHKNANIIHGEVSKN